MSLYKNPLEAIYAAVEAQNNITLVRDEYTMSVPVAYVDPLGQTNTSITISAISPRSPYDGSVTVHYTRLDLAILANYLPSPLRGHGLTTILAVQTLLNKNYGLNFQTTDLEQGPVTTLVSDQGSVTLTAAENSLGWIGTVDLDFVKGDYDINAVVTVKDLPGMVYPARDESKPFGEFYSYWRDFTAYQSTLTPLTVQGNDLETIRGVLATETKAAWVTNANGRYSLLGASIFYNGPVAGYPRSNPAYGYVLVVDLGVGSLGFSGQLILHYGLPPIGPA